MNSKRVYYAMIGMMGITVLLIMATVLLGDKLLHKQSEKLINLKLDNQVIDAQQTALGQAKKDIEKYSELEATAKQIVPQDKDQARATREIINLANQAGIKIANIGFPASTLGQPVIKPATPSANNQTAPTTPVAPTTPSVTQVKPVEGIKNLLQLDITVTSDPANPTTYISLIDFLTRLEQNRRTAQVSQISIHPDAKDRNSLNFTLTITLYIRP